MHRREALGAIAAGIVGVGAPAHVLELVRDGGAGLEFDEAGLPYRATIRDGSPYTWRCSDVVVLLDGRMPGGCYGFDRRGGYVECVEVEGPRWWYDAARGWPTIRTPVVEVKRFGRVEVRWRTLEDRVREAERHLRHRRTPLA